MFSLALQVASLLVAFPTGFRCTWPSSPDTPARVKIPDGAAAISASPNGSKFPGRRRNVSRRQSRIGNNDFPWGGSRRGDATRPLHDGMQVSHNRLVIQGPKGSWSWSSRPAAHMCIVNPGCCIFSTSLETRAELRERRKLCMCARRMHVHQ